MQFNVNHINASVNRLIAHEVTARIVENMLRRSLKVGDDET